MEAKKSPKADLEKKKETIPGPVVQLNRTSDSGSESRGFESRRGHKN